MGFEPKIIGFTGARDGMTPQQAETFNCMMENLRPTTGHHGLCMGSDVTAHGIWRQHGVWIVGHPPANTRYMVPLECDEMREPKEFLVRDHDIVNESELLVATPSSPEVLRSGTWATIRHARRTSKPVRVIWLDGSILPDEPI